MPRISRKQHNKQDAANIPRPLNCFLFYRLEKQKEILEKCPGANHRDISKVIAKWWKQASDEEKMPYVEKARRAKQEHGKLYPNYKYAPKKKNTPKRMYRRKNRDEPFTSRFQENNELLEMMYDDSISLDDNSNLPPPQNIEKTPVTKTESFSPYDSFKSAANPFTNTDYFSYPAVAIPKSQPHLVSPLPDTFSEYSFTTTSSASSPYPDCHSVTGNSNIMFASSRNLSPFSSLTTPPTSPETNAPTTQIHQQSVNYFPTMTPITEIDTSTITMPLIDQQEFCWPEFPFMVNIEITDYFNSNDFYPLLEQEPEQPQYPASVQFIDPSLLIM